MRAMSPSKTRVVGRRFRNRPTGTSTDPFLCFVGALCAALFQQTSKELSMQVVHFIQKFARDEEGVTAIEYGLIAALIAVVIVAAVTLVGTKLNGVFASVAAAL
jgi:pilus assembly protein Flp/PilA